MRVWRLITSPSRLPLAFARACTREHTRNLSRLPAVHTRNTHKHSALQTLDWMEEERLLHMIGCALSKDFDSAEQLIRRAGERGGSTMVQFSKCVDLCRDDNVLVSSLSPPQVQQLCKKAGGDDRGFVSGKRLSELMQEHDWRRQVRKQVSDAVFDKRLTSKNILRRVAPPNATHLTKKEFHTMLSTLLDRPVPHEEADAVFDWECGVAAGVTPRYTPDREEAGASRMSIDACCLMLEGGEAPLDWEKETIKQLCQQLTARGTSVAAAIKVRRNSQKSVP